MSKELKISPITIKRAYSDLENEGYIITRSGLGSFVADINKDRLRSDKLSEITKELSKIVQTCEKFNISAENIITIIKKMGVSQ